MTIAITIVMNNLSILNLKMMSCLVKISYDSAKISKNVFQTTITKERHLVTMEPSLKC